MAEIERAGSGLHALGVAIADPFPDTRADLESRVVAGMHGTLRFTFADPARATDVRASFPWAERLVVGAWSYLPQAGDPGPAVPGTGRVARFATEDHYRGLRGSLAEIAGVLQAAGHRAEVLVDDSRLVDRAAAVRAGVGWWGKSAMVLAPGAGPWILLGSVATDAVLEPTSHQDRTCGTCVACMPACPTGAIVAPGILDARRCIAHWLQAPGVIPPAIRPAVGDRIYGCDDCLDACPPGIRLRDTAPAGVGRVDLVAVLQADDASLLRRFEHWFVPRRQARFIRRNALVALGNAGGRDSVAVAAGYLGHPDWLLRAHAAWCLGRLGGPIARAALEARIPLERDRIVVEEIAAARGTLG